AIAPWPGWHRLRSRLGPASARPAPWDPGRPERQAARPPAELTAPSAPWVAPQARLAARPIARTRAARWPACRGARASGADGGVQGSSWRTQISWGAFPLDGGHPIAIVKAGQRDC